MRNYDEKYKVWRVSVLNRDGCKCVRCGSFKKVQAHHKRPWASYPELRYDISNGETVCLDCHLSIHPFMIKYLNKKHKKRPKSQKHKKYVKFLKSNGIINKTPKKHKVKDIKNRYAGYSFSIDNPNPNWG